LDLNLRALPYADLVPKILFCTVLDLCWNSFSDTGSGGSRFQGSTGSQVLPRFLCPRKPWYRKNMPYTVMQTMIELNIIRHSGCPANFFTFRLTFTVIRSIFQLASSTHLTSARIITCRTMMSPTGTRRSLSTDLPIHHGAITKESKTCLEVVPFNADVPVGARHNLLIGHYTPVSWIVSTSLDGARTIDS
jgi:hypothetical protein